jgi:hypothetical protein
VLFVVVTVSNIEHLVLNTGIQARELRHLVSYRSSALMCPRIFRLTSKGRVHANDTLIMISMILMGIPISMVMSWWGQVLHLGPYSIGHFIMVMIILIFLIMTVKFITVEAAVFWLLALEAENCSLPGVSALLGQGCLPNGLLC